MKPNFKVIDAGASIHASSGPYQEIAIYVRRLLGCEYALVVAPDRDSIRVHGFAGADGAADGGLAVELISRLRDWGPVVVDDARLIAVPVTCGDHVMGVLIGYSSEPGAFTAQHLEKLTSYAPVALGIMTYASLEANSDTRTLSADELLHVFRLITIGEFSACFAHEVRNPLTLIRGHLLFIDEGLEADHPLRFHVEAIDRASQRIEEMAKRMLDFSKKRTPRSELCEIPELIADAIRFIQPYIRTKSIDIEVHLDPQLPAIEADRWQMVQAIVNILQNAADAMAEVDRRILSVSAGVEQDQVRITISDSGVGISPANISKIFEPFFTTKGDRGTGLGLYITKQVIEEHRGTVNVATSERGTSFSIGLPLHATQSGAHIPT
jgi:signal transduction histidine kinase